MFPLGAYDFTSALMRVSGRAFGIAIFGQRPGNRWALNGLGFI